MSFSLSRDTKNIVCRSVDHASKCNDFVIKGMHVVKTMPFHCFPPRHSPRSYSLVLSPVRYYSVCRENNYDMKKDDLTFFHDMCTVLELCLVILQSLPLKSSLLSFQFMTISYFHMIDKVKTPKSSPNFNAGFIFTFLSNGIYHKLVKGRR